MIITKQYTYYGICTNNNKTFSAVTLSLHLYSELTQGGDHSMN